MNASTRVQGRRICTKKQGRHNKSESYLRPSTREKQKYRSFEPSIESSSGWDLISQNPKSLARSREIVASNILNDSF